MGRGFPHGHPSGWFQVAWSGEFEPGDVRPARYFGQDLVLFRGASGQMAVLDAHCPHMGAHLGYGGRVAGDDIICPFHEWQWSAKGENVAIPYSDQAPYRRRIRCWQVLEQSGLVLVWYDPSGGEPTWTPPPVPEFESADYYPVYPHGAARDSLRLYPQFVLENMVDYAHLGSVHNWNVEPPQIDLVEEREYSFVANTSGVMDTPRGPAKMCTLNEAWGVALVISRLSGLRDTAFVSCVTPIDDERSEVWCSTAVKRGDDKALNEPDSFAKAMIAGQNEAILGSNPGDRDIWEHQIYLPRPSYVREEAAGFRALRQWTERFYATTGAATPGS